MFKTLFSTYGEAWWFTHLCGLMPNVGLMEIVSSLYLQSLKHWLISIVQNGNSRKMLQVMHLKETTYFLPRKLSFVTVLLSIKQNTVLLQIKPRYQGFQNLQDSVSGSGKKERKRKRKRERHQRAGKVCRDSLEPCQSPDKKNKRG